MSVTLRFILPIDAKNQVKAYLSTTYPGWQQLLIQVLPEKAIMVLYCQLPTNITWTQENDSALDAYCRRNKEYPLLFWDRIYTQVGVQQHEQEAGELLKALQGLVGGTTTLVQALEYHSGSTHEQNMCPVCLATNVYRAYC